MENNEVEKFRILKKLQTRYGYIKEAFPLSDVALICVQHLINTTAVLFHYIETMGFLPENIFICGKQYSTCPSVVDQMKGKFYIHPSIPLEQAADFQDAVGKDMSYFWDYIIKRHKQKPFKKIIILDDGGRCKEWYKNYYPKLKNIPSVIIEQTTAGFFKYPDLFATIDVAGSAVKKQFESDIIVKEIFAAIQDDLHSIKDLRIGLIGVGTIGRKLLKKLVNDNFSVNIFDIDNIESIDNDQIKKYSSLSELVKDSNYILGCTGRDISEVFVNNNDFFSGDKIFVSCSSEDFEFKSLITYIEKQLNKERSDRLSDIVFETGTSRLVVKRGGFPINFNNIGEKADPQDIELTRALLLVAVIQALDLLRKQNSTVGRIMLDVNLQKFVLNEWLMKKTALSHNMIPSNNEWVIDKSSGTYHLDSQVDDSEIFVLSALE